MTTHTLSSLGWNPFFEEQLASLDLRSVVIVRVSAHHSSEVEVCGEGGSFRVPVQCAEADGKVAIGDWLVLDASDHRAVRRLERKTLLARKAAGEEVKPQILVANVDTLFIVSSCNEDFNLSRIERYLAMALQAGAEPVLVLTKADLCEDPGALADQARQLHPGLAVEFLDARSPGQAESLAARCGPGRSVALLGSSGVGKSTLANTLGAGDCATGGPASGGPASGGPASGGLATGSIREQDGKGRHTTTSRSLHLLPTGGVLVDNPGVREFQLRGCEEGVADLFEDVVALIAGCRFSDCKHEGEPGCAIRAAIEGGRLDERRFASYEKLEREQARNAMALARRRDRERKQEQVYKSAIARKRRGRGGR